MYIQYQELLKHKSWLERTDNYIKSVFTNGNEVICPICKKPLSEGNKLYLHHKFYIENLLPWDYENWQLVLLHEECHTKYHENNHAWNYPLDEYESGKDKLYSTYKSNEELPLFDNRFIKKYKTFQFNKKIQQNTILVKQSFASANIIDVELEYNGCQGGDSGHGGFVRIKFENAASTNMMLNGREVEKFEIRFGGDCERYTLIEALKMIAEELEFNHNKI